MVVMRQTKLKFLLLMCIFGGLGPAIKIIGLPSTVTAALRAWIAALTLILFMLITKRKIDKTELKKCLRPMLICGVFLAGDWIGLFESYNYTSIACATACYYVAPLLVLFGSALFFRERVTQKHTLCAFVSFAGMILISGVVRNGFTGSDTLQGITWALSGAISYAVVVLINKKYSEYDPLLRTTIQLVSTTVLMTVYVLLRTDLTTLHTSALGIVVLLILGVGMTAIPYVLYFNWIVALPARTVAMFSYADPVVAVLISIFIMHEAVTILEVLGILMIVGASMVSEIGKRGQSCE